VFNVKTSIHILGFVLYLGFHFHHWLKYSPLSIYFIIIHCFKDAFNSLLHLVSVRDVLSGVLFKILPETFKTFSLCLLVLDDGRLLNPFLPMYIFPSTSTHFL
jgi:hypothetical protein